ncbi:MAG: FAD-binding protein, partial [Pseudomonadota bacterium]
MTLSQQNKKARKTAARIARKIGGGKVIDDPEQLEKYSRDESHQRPVLPAAVVFPESTADVSAIMKAASHDGVFLTPRGGGTGKSGGAVPVRGGIVMSMEKMNG